MVRESKFNPPWWLSNRHVQTFWGPLAPKLPLPKLDRQRVYLEDGDFLDIDWVNRDKTAPTVILLHGLEGNLDSPYLRRMLFRLNEIGWRGALVYWRGCSGEFNPSSKTYHAGRSDDLEAVVNSIAESSQPLFIAGYSLGANILLKWLGEKGQDNIKVPVTASFAVSTPFDLSVCADAIDQGFSKIYKHYLLASLKKRIIKKHSNEELLSLLNLTAKDILLINGMREFDQRISSKLNGFIDADDYYIQCSSGPLLKYIQQDVMILHAEDDPFMTPEIIPKAEDLSDSLQLKVSKHGGHVGFVQDIDKKGTSFFLEDTILEYFHSKLITNNAPEQLN